jgi:hypothetical protein
LLALLRAQLQPLFAGDVLGPQVAPLLRLQLSDLAALLRLLLHAVDRRRLLLGLRLLRALLLNLLLLLGALLNAFLRPLRALDCG